MARTYRQYDRADARLLMPARLSTKNKCLGIHVSQDEKEIIMRAATQREISVSDIARSLLLRWAVCVFENDAGKH